MQGKLEATLAALIAIPSVSDDHESCRRIIEYVREQLNPLGLHMYAQLDKAHPWLIATTRATKSPKLLLVAHLDVVPASEDGQYELKKEGSRLYGRGVWDMKFAAAVYLELLKAHAGRLVEFDVGVLFTTDEEIGGYQGSAEALRQGWRTEVAFIPDGAKNWRIEQRAKGHCAHQLTAYGRNAHGSRPWEGENAIQKLIPVLHELQTIYPSDQQEGPTLSINIISGGEVSNQIPNEASAWLDFRAFDKLAIEEYEILLDRLANEYDLKIFESGFGRPLELDKANPHVIKYASTLEAIGITPTYQDSFGASDARWFNEHGIPCIVTSSHGGSSHAPNEWMLREDLSTFYNILEHFITHSNRD